MTLLSQGQQCVKETGSTPVVNTHPDLEMETKESE